MAVKFQLRRGLSTEWTSANPILMQGELGIELDTEKIKIGDGIKTWTNLPYMARGERGLTGDIGPIGKKIEFSWNGTTLGVREEGSSSYQYVDLKGEKGDIGAIGKSLQFDWNGTQLGVRVEGQLTYQYTDLKGVKGDRGNDLEFSWNGVTLGVREKGTSTYVYSTSLKGEKGDTGTIANLTSTHVTDALGYTPLAKGLSWGDLIV